MQTVGIVTHPRKQRAQKLLADVRSFLARKGFRILDSLTDGFSDIVNQSDLIITLGGDGTLLNLVNRLMGRSVPIFGVNLGSLGFITDIKVDEVFEELELVFSGRAREEERFMLKGALEGSRFQADSFSVWYAVNDVVIHRESLSRFLQITLSVNGHVVYRVSGDGIIISTPTGSTGYNLSANGPIVHPTAENIIVTPICHHSLIQKTIVLAPRDEVCLSIRSKDETGGARLIVDGQAVCEMVEGDTLRICGSERKFRLIRNSKRDYFDVLKEKFGWVV